MLWQQPLAAAARSVMSRLLILMSVLLAGAASQTPLPAAALLQRAEREGTPLVDRLEDSRYVQLTLRLHGSAGTRNMAVVGTFLPAPIVAMTRMAALNVWSMTATVPAGARFDYWLAENRRWYLKVRKVSTMPPEEHRVTVYTPAGYRTSGPPNALMVVFDGGAY